MLKHISLSVLLCSMGLIAVSCTGGASRPAQLQRIADRPGDLPNASGDFRFAVISDRAHLPVPGVLAQTVAEINRSHPDFVMSVGDFIEGYTEDAAQLRAWWKEVDGELSGLQAPFFFCPGNHDTKTAACRQVYTELHGRSGKTYYSFDYRGCHFIVLDSTAVKYDANGGKVVAQSQWTWLKKDLAQSRSAKHVFIFDHHPMSTDAKPFWAQLRPLLAADKTTIFCGHTHELMYSATDGVPQYTLAATAAHIDNVDRSTGDFPMYAMVTVSGGKPTVAVLPVGQVLRGDWMTPQVLATVEAARGPIAISPLTQGTDSAAVTITNSSKLPVQYTLQWSDPGNWLQGRPQGPQSLQLQPGQSSRQEVKLVPQATTAPSLNVGYSLNVDGRELAGSRTVSAAVVPTVVATRQSIKVDGDLGDWDKAAGVRAPAAITATRPSADGSMNVRVAYDDQNLYVAMEVSDDKLVDQGQFPWMRDGVGIFWDPRPAAQQDEFAGDCRQVVLPLPAAGQPVAPHTNPALPELAKDMQVRFVRIDGGYRVEAAIPLSQMAKDFKPAAGKSLRMNFYVYDKDKPDGDAKFIIFSGTADASRTTSQYAVVAFE